MRKTRIAACIAALFMALAVISPFTTAYAADGKSATGTLTQDTSVHFTNTRDQIIPTGVIVAGWVGGAAVVIAAATILIVKSKKRKNTDEGDI